MGGEPDAAAAGSSRCFVGRDEIRATVARYVDQAGTGYRVRTGGTWGIGKTWLVERLHDDASGRAVLLHVDAGAYVPFDQAAPDENRRALDLVRNWNSYVDVLFDLVADAPATEEWNALAAQVQEAVDFVANVRAGTVTFEAEIDVGEGFSAEDDAQVASPTIYADAVAEREAAISAKVQLLREAFVATADRAALASGVVILVDAFDRLRGHPVSDWLLRLLTGTSHAVVVVATRVPPDEGSAGTRLLEPGDLAPFEAEEIRAYLEQRLGADAADATLVERVRAFSQGLPQAVAMAADLIEQRRRTGGELRLDDIGADPSTAATKLLSTIVREVPEPDVALLLREARFARRLDADLVHYLLHGTRYEAGDEPQRARADAALNALRTYSFLEEHRVGAGDGLGRFNFHEYIARARPVPGDDTLDVDEERVHARLATYYERRLDDYDDERSQENSYMQLYKLERRDWQALTREALHHAGRLRRPEARAAARLSFLRVFLQMFWWWGCYVRYDPCEHLVNDWERTQPDDELEVVASLRAVLAGYPVGHDKLDGGDWAAVEVALRELASECGVDGKVPLDDSGVEHANELKQRSNRRWVRALLSLFRAHSHRFRAGHGRLALRLYDDVLAHLRAEHATAAVAWTTFELAELHLELGDEEQAAARLAESARLLAVAAAEDEEPEDLELLANLQRLHGDLAAARGDVDSAVDATARAVLRAWAFLDSPEPPDAYNVQFYEELRERAARRLLAISTQHGVPAAEAAAARLLAALATLRRPFGLADGAAAAAAALERSDPAALVALLPPPPAVLGTAAREDPVFGPTALFVLDEVRRDASDEALRAPA